MAWLKPDELPERKPLDPIDLAASSARTMAREPAGAAAVKPAATVVAAAKPATVEHKEPAREPGSILGPTLRFKGELRADEDFTLQGQIEGSIHHSQNLTIGPDGLVKGDSRALTIVVEGTVEGDMYALESISVRATARVNGNLFAPRISIAEGASFNGRIDMASAAKAARSIVERQHGATMTPAEVEKALVTGQ